MKIEIFKIAMNDGWPYLKALWGVVAFLMVCWVVALKYEVLRMFIKKMLLSFKIMFSLVLFGLTLLFDSFSEGILYFKWPEEITLIQIFVLTILLIDMCISFIDVFDKK